MRYYRVQGEGGPTEAVEYDGLLYVQNWTIAEGLVAQRGEELGPADQLQILAPIRPGKIVAVGLNYRDHIGESGADAPASPLIFAKFPSSVIGAEDPIVVDPKLVHRADWEVELAVVIGRQARHLAIESALNCVFGYTVANDVSARNVQFADGQWTRGKSFDTFCPLGPCIVEAREIADPQRIMLRTRVNGEVMQEASTELMIFPVAQLLVFCTACFTLEPGDILLTGTPWGCGEFMKPKRSLRPGDLVEVSAEGIGSLRNPVVAATSPREGTK